VTTYHRRPKLWPHKSVLPTDIAEPPVLALQTWMRGQAMDHDQIGTVQQCNARSLVWWAISARWLCGAEISLCLTPWQKHQFGSFLSLFEERLPHRAYLRTHGQPTG
jgi:hypothetical protein